MATDKKNVSAKTDAQIIAANPGATPFELLTEHGLSQQGYEALLTQLDAKEQQNISPNLMIPASVKPNLSHRVEPELTSVPLRQHAHLGSPDSSRIMMRDKKSGRVFPLSNFAGERLLKKNPAQYEKA